MFLPTNQRLCLSTSIILVDPAERVPVVDRLFESKLIPGPEETTEPELNVRFPTLSVLATVVTPSIDVAPATDKVEPINVSASILAVVTMFPLVEISVVPCRNSSVCISYTVCNSCFTCFK